MAPPSSDASGTAHPFGIPGLQLPGGDSNVANPVLQSLEMMRQVWASLGALSQAPVSPTTGLDELDRRLADLRAVENWLNLNLTMLRGTIQGLEVQRATISTLRSFAQAAGAAQACGSQEAPPSPLEVALGLRKPAEPQPGTAGNASSASQPNAAAEAPGAGAWWNMLKEQFDRIAAVATAGPGTPSPAPASKSKTSVAKPSGARKPAAKPGGPAPRRARPPKA